MFDEVEAAPGTQYAADLAHCRDRVWNGAQSPRRERCIERVIFELQDLSVEADELSVEIGQLISLINTDDTIQATTERLDAPALEAGDGDE